MEGAVRRRARAVELFAVCRAHHLAQHQTHHIGFILPEACIDEQDAVCTAMAQKPTTVVV